MIIETTSGGDRRVMMQRTEQQIEIILREMWTNLVGHHADLAIRWGAPGEEVMQTIDDEAGEQQNGPDPDSLKAVELKRMRHATGEATKRGATVEHIKCRVSVSLWQCGTFSESEISTWMGIDRAGFKKLCRDMEAAQKTALEESILPHERAAYGLDAGCGSFGK